MSDIDGRWRIDGDSPMGKQTSTLDVKVEGSTATGLLIEDNGDQSEIRKGTFDGSVLSYTVDVTKPMKLSVVFTLTLGPEGFRGKAKAGLFPPSKVTGTRI
jgi:hypothetical protein